MGRHDFERIWKDVGRTLDLKGHGDDVVKIKRGFERILYFLYHGICKDCGKMLERFGVPEGF